MNKDVRIKLGNLQGLQEILWLSLARNKLAVAKTYRTFLRGFAWEVGAFKA
jgi:hypothetical protein